MTLSALTVLGIYVGLISSCLLSPPPPPPLSPLPPSFTCSFHCRVLKDLGVCTESIRGHSSTFLEAVSSLQRGRPAYGIKILASTCYHQCSVVLEYSCNSASHPLFVYSFPMGRGSLGTRLHAITSMQCDIRSSQCYYFCFTLDSATELSLSYKARCALWNRHPQSFEQEVIAHPRSVETCYPEYNYTPGLVV